MLNMENIVRVVRRRIVNYLMRRFNILFIRGADFSEPSRNLWGDDFVEIWLKYKDRTLIGASRSFTLYNALNYVVKNNISGSLVECGVFAGGACGMMAEFLSRKNASGRNIFLFDTFSGMPEAEDVDRYYPSYGSNSDSSVAAKNLARDARRKEGKNWNFAALDLVKDTMARSGYPADNIHYIEGMVEDTLPRFARQDIALLRLDTDFYKSTKAELDILYDQVVPGGVIIIDDFSSFEGSRRATLEFLGERNITPLMFHDYTCGAVTFIKNI